MNRSDYIRTKSHELSLNSLKMNLDDSFKDVISICPNIFYSHFINVIIEKDDKVFKISNDEFNKLNHIIRSSISHINNKGLSFVDDDPFEKTMMEIKERDLHIKMQTKIINGKYLSILKQHIEYLTL